MFWDKVAGVYDIFTKIINKKTHKTLCAVVEKLISQDDNVLECACGTGLLSGVIAKKCKSLVATDFSVNMLKKAKRKYGKLKNVEFKQGNILQIEYHDESFDVVVAANVIHLLDEPYKALSELDRVCKNGGKIIIPTYMNRTSKGKTNGLSNAIDKAGADFKREFTLDSYKEFIAAAGYTKTEYFWCEGKIPCAVAVIVKNHTENLKSE